MIINNLLTNPYSRKSGSQRESGLRRIVCLAALLVCFFAQGWALQNLVYIGGTLLSDGTYNKNSGIGITQGTVEYNSSQNQLTLNQAVINVSSGAAMELSSSGLTVKLMGDCTIKAAGVGIDVYKPFTVTGDATLTITSSTSGIYFEGSSTLTVSGNATVSAEGTEYGIRGVSGKYGKLTMTDNATLKAKGTKGSICWMDLRDGPQKNGFPITRPKGATYNYAINGSIVDSNSSAVKGEWVVFEKAIAINETNFPDENFRNWLLEQLYGADGVLTPAEIADVTSINVYGESITSLEGIEYFTALTELYCSSNKLTALDVSNNTALEKLYCENNQLTSLDVTNNTALTKLWCYINQLTTLDVTKNTALTQLYCDNNQLTSLDVSKNTALTVLACHDNQLTELDVTNNTALEMLFCGDNQLTELDVTKNTELTLLDCSNNLIRGEGMTVLVSSLPRHSTTTSYDLRVYNNETPAGNMMTPAQVKVATDKGWSVLQYIDDEWVAYEGEEPGIAIDETNFPDENFRAYVSAETIDQDKDGYLSDEEIASVTEINVSEKNIKDLTGIGYFTALTKLYCANNQLTSLDVSHNTALQYLRFDKNPITSIDLSNNTALKLIECYMTSLSELDLSHNTELTYLRCTKNKLTELDVSNNTKLWYMLCDGNQLTELDLSNNTKLEGLECYSNKLTSLNLSKNVALGYLNCRDNLLTALDVSNNTAIYKLNCGENPLGELNLSKNTALGALYCDGNQLTELDVTNNKKLEEIACYRNSIRGAAITRFFNSLPEPESGTLLFYYTWDERENNTQPTTVQLKTAQDKHWSVRQWSVDYWASAASVIRRGDANGDGEINALDVDCLRDYILGRNPKPFSLESADLDESGTVDIVDLTRLIEMLK